jgi:hypothetical protein
VSLLVQGVSGCCLAVCVVARCGNILIAQTDGTILGSTKFALRYDRISVDYHTQDQCPSCLSHFFQSEMSVEFAICLSLALSLLYKKSGTSPLVIILYFVGRASWTVLAQ